MEAIILRSFQLPQYLFGSRWRIGRSRTQISSNRHDNGLGLLVLCPNRNDYIIFNIQRLVRGTVVIGSGCAGEPNLAVGIAVVIINRRLQLFPLCFFFLLPFDFCLSLGFPISSYRSQQFLFCFELFRILTIPVFSMLITGSPAYLLLFEFFQV